MLTLCAINENIMMERFIKLKQQSTKKYGEKISFKSFAILLVKLNQFYYKFLLQKIIKGFKIRSFALNPKIL